MNGRVARGRGDGLRGGRGRSRAADGAGIRRRCDSAPGAGHSGTERFQEADGEKAGGTVRDYHRTGSGLECGPVEAAEIDEMDILNARMLVMQRAIDGLSLRPELALIDGNRDHGSRYAIETPHCLIVGGDGKSASIAAASILAKVSRDRYVAEVLDKQYPQYQFAKHKGYGTKLHYQMLDRYGPCPEHRETFLKKWEARRRG